MFNLKRGFGRKRSRLSGGVVLLILIPIIGFHVVRGELQKGEEWSGTVVRVYSERSFLGRRSFDHYWDVRTTSGEICSPIITKSQWNNARVGDQVVKQAGVYIPMVVGRR